ncbi:type IX secretion system anionic LPS delivery protein PorZ [Riemerella anatipestifer]|uniref:type IX secretion system anionic LPS delivery protein PorZ n=1 Tax=Riemerella anatipestifer TaxID=34085 RepID=UPI00129EBF83|nr:two-component regulator propeller domain-containing protein [Riemerella anatipestifer]MCU7542581.1 T9SS type A sorting domain-containing protein [Riemerella anatipestifer]MCU7545949.1 T9SS type A sorting domain-containing protein [Riemerella anatipestifer]MCU7597394.1 T9SS type A sorting domain-containing protein [Riemerella anatipestifer]MCW0475736.1 T9SS type A sorting domain-containing protein [Riemerella anatipestifer]MCW0494401.1 T9SS type A sorting domain-containing protein [Riemerell
MKKIFSFLVLSIGFLGLAQGSKWQDLFSYNHIIKIEQDGAELIAVTKSGLFYYNVASGEIRKLSKANGLHEVGITAFDYNPDTKIGLIGYETGALDIVTPNGVTLIVDIPIARSYQGSKKINHIFIKDNLAIISAGYGVSIFNLDKKEFGETVFFQEGTNFIASNEAFVKDNVVYASTSRGLYSHKIDLEFSIYLTWQRLNAFDLLQSDTNGQDYLFATKTEIYFGNNFQRLPYSFTNIKDVVYQTNSFLVCDVNKIYQFSTDGILQNTYDFSSYYLTTGAMYDGKLFVGTAFSGILDQNFISIKPDGPYSNTASRITLVEDKIWVAAGRKGSYYQVIYDNNLGYYYYDGTRWVYPQYFLDNSQLAFNILDIAVNPSNPSEIYFTNYVQRNSKGVYKMIDNKLSKVFNTSSAQWYNVPEYLVFDKNNNLFATFSFFEGDVNFGGMYFISRDGSRFETIKTANIKTSSSGILAFNDRLFIGGPRASEGGLLIYYFNNTPTRFDDDLRQILRVEEGLPSASVTAMAMDKNNSLWLGSTTGLRILPNALSDLYGTKVKVNPIVITQNGIAEELFKDAEILSIAVDSGNNKWVSVNGGGVFFLSADGQKVYNHFTKANSPLPSDEVTDIKINDKTGQVYFATSNGIVVYKGDVANVTSKFGEVVVYPNPVVYSQFKGNVKIKGLAEKTNIRITDAAGNLIHQAVSRNGYYEWNLQNQRGSRVASGIYFVLMTNEDGTDKATAKIAVVN